MTWIFSQTTKLSITIALLIAVRLHGDEPHWAYRPLRQPSLPVVEQVEWSANPIDRFIARRWEVDRLSAAAAADRVTLIRRLSLDLIGLPPTPQEVAEFINDVRPGAYERLVDRLLASHHYGERWAQPWLDLCHYADSDGYLTDQLRPVAWRYRAWLVNALNANLPFDQFTIQQLAGDLLPNATIEQKLATGFLRQTLSNREGGADPEEFRVKQIVDRTSMVGEIWMGLTVGCAQCHEHKYDDISQKEFYQLYAFLNAADEINLDAPLPDERESYESALPEYHRKRQALIAPLAKKLDTLQGRWESKLLRARDNPGLDWYWDRQWELLGLVWGGGLGEGQLEGWQIVMLDPKKRTRLQRDRLLDYFIPMVDTIDAKKAKELKIGELRAKLEKLKSDLPKVTRAPTMMETQNPRMTYVHLSGDFRDRGEFVFPDTLDMLPPFKAKHYNRLALAKWLVTPEHPLTARVAVNRMWQEFFGRGLVATPGDFGVRGAPPTHPQLLDWLAGEFLRSGWDVKHMHRLIASSATYRQSSQAERPSKVDPENKLLARQMPLRLAAEQIRDSILRTSGLWDSRIGGPSVKPPQPDSVSEQGYHNTWKTSEGGNRYRRGLYTWVQRTSPFAMHIAFDAPNPNHICTRRDRSNTPLQALTLLNDPVFFEAAASLAERVHREIVGDDRQQIVYAFKLCLARIPTQNELTVLTRLLQQLREDEVTDNPWTVLCSVFFNLHEFVTRN